VFTFPVPLPQNHGENWRSSQLCAKKAGISRTSFGKNARRADGSDTNRSGQDFLRIPPDQVVRTALDALVQNRACVFPGTGVSLAGPLFRVMPRALMRWIIERRHRQEHSPK
jgi:short-subunit dehydrogenase